MELLCKVCGKWAKYRFQKLKLTKVYDPSNRMVLQIYEVIPQKQILVEIES